MADKEISLHDAKIFSQIYERYLLTVFRYIYGMTGGPRQEVEDLTAETFFRAWNKRSQFQGSDQAALGWLLAIARNLVFDTYRRKKLHPEIGFEENWSDLFYANQPNPEMQIIEQEQFQTLWQLLKLLQTEQREIILLRYVFGWQVKEIAQLTHCNENTVSVNLHRTMKKIQQDWPNDK
jgi:RNA polymerase sigma-70 factor (ECF subfamily)